MNHPLRRLLAALLCACTLTAVAAPPKVLRVAFNAAETGFDPAKISDIYSRTVTPHIFEALYTYDPLARPFKIKPLTAAGMPETSADFRDWTIRVQPGITYADDPVFKGVKRELVAADYVYAIKRLIDPANKSPVGSTIQDLDIVGLNALRDETVAKAIAFDYDREVEGLRTLDRYTLKITLERPRPRLLQILAASDLVGGTAREVVEHYGDDIMAHPVGTGPFRLVQWRRSSLIVLERNPDYRERLYDAEPGPDDVDGQEILARLKGKRLPMVDRVEVSIITEEQPRWLTFLNGGLDLSAIPSVAIAQAIPNNRLAPNLAKKGIRHYRSLNADGVYTFFNMEDPMVGGITPAQVALRRALSLSLNVPKLISQLYRNQGIPSQSLFIPWCSGYDPDFKSEMGDYDPSRAKALLDLYGFKDRGWRRLPRAARRLAAGHRDRDPARPVQPPVRRSLAEGLRRRRHPRELLRRAVVGAAESGLRRQAADVDPGGLGRQPGRAGHDAVLLQQADRQRRQLRALPQPGDGPHLRRSGTPARRPRARRPVLPGQAHRYRADALQVADAPLQQHPGLQVSDRLPPAAVLDRVVASGGHPEGRGAMKCLSALVLGLAVLAQQPALAQAAAKKVLRVAFNTPETSFDPVQISDLYSRTITPHIFEGLYQYDHLARPAVIKPLTAAAMPEVSPDFTTWTVRVTPGIFFADDPAFKGKPRELTARDYVYSILRTADPANRSEIWTYIASLKIAGLAAKRQKHLDDKTPFDYDSEPEGLRTLDRYTLQFRLQAPDPRFGSNLASSDNLGAVAREVVEFYGARIGEHPVGTGPFRLKSWRRSSMIVLERNPDYRGRFYDAEPAADDVEGQAILARLRGKRLPIVDEVQISIIDEDQPMWLSFLNGEIDALVSKTGSVPGNFVVQAMPGGVLAPNLAKHGIQGRQSVNPDIAITYFNMEDPVVGGYTAEKVALRRAIGLAHGHRPRDQDHPPRPGHPGAVEHRALHHRLRPAFQERVGRPRPGARERPARRLRLSSTATVTAGATCPTARPLLLNKATQPEQIYRQFDELFRKNMEAIRVKVRFETGQWPEHLKKARAGKLQIWALGSSAAGTDGQSALYRLHGPQSGSQNLARFKLAEFDALYERMARLPDGPEREALFFEAKKIAVAYMPYKPTVHRISTDLWYPWLIGYRRPPFWNEWWHMVDVDADMRQRAQQ